MTMTEEVLKLVEANKIMSGLIDRLFVLLLQHMSIDEIEQMDVYGDMERAALTMRDYEE